MRAAAAADDDDEDDDHEDDDHDGTKHSGGVGIGSDSCAHRGDDDCLCRSALRIM
jgi:hypothetical protein